MAPQVKAAISRPKTTGTAIIVDRRPTPPIPTPMPAEINIVSTPKIIGGRKHRSLPPLFACGRETR